MNNTWILDAIRTIHSRPLRKRPSDGNLDRRNGRLVARDSNPVDEAALREGRACGLCLRRHSARTRQWLNERNRF